MAGDRVSLLWTDAPYNVAYEGVAGSILNDNMTRERFRAFLVDAFRACDAVMPVRYVSPMPVYKLTYFDAAASRGEECRLALHLAGVPFQDERLKADQWAVRKGSTPFGALPVLTVDGRQLAQSNAILRFIGSQHGLHPSEPFEVALHESLMCAVEDLRMRMAPITRIKDELEKKRARREAASGYLQEWGAAIERQIGPGAIPRRREPLRGRSEALRRSPSV